MELYASFRIKNYEDLNVRDRLEAARPVGLGAPINMRMYSYFRAIRIEVVEP